MKLKGIKLLSVDLFDTLVTRTFAYPADVFYALERKLCQGRGEEKFNRFAKARMAGEYQLREEKGFKHEVTLDEIYERLRLNLALSKEQAKQVREMELELEEQSILPIKQVVDFIKELKEIKDLKIILVSDTYLPEKFITKILGKNKLSDLFDRIYVSSTHKVLKSAGSMYRFVEREENIPVKKWHHIGDNTESDYKIPRKMGIQAEWFREAHLTRYEKNAAPLPGSLPGQSTFAALMRQSRLDCPYKDEREKVIWETTVNVSAPLIIAYVQWCLEKAHSQGVNRVYFLARDGQILSRIASILNRFFRPPLEIRYLYVSRQSLLFPAIRGIDDESLEWILAPTSLVTPRIILQRINIEPGEIKPILKKHGYVNADQGLSKKELDNFKLVLRESDVRSLVQERIKIYRENTLGYLHQEGVTKDGKFALVDIGWNGSLQRSISRLLDMKGKNFPVNGLYFGLRRVLKHKPSDKLETFFFSPEKSQGLEKESNIVPIIEMFTAAGHGGVVKYEFEDNHYKPVLQRSENTHGIRWGIRIQQQAMTYLAERIEGNSLDDLLPSTYQNLRLFVRTPSLREAEVYGSFLDAEDQNESYYFPLARRYNWLELFRHYKYGYLHHHNEWKEGARRLSRGLFGRYLWHRFSKTLDCKEVAHNEPF